MRMREIESQGSGHIFRPQGRFLLRAIVELQFGRRRLRIACQQLPQDSSSGNEVIPIARKVKPLRPCFLIGRERSLKLAHQIWSAIQEGSPDMNVWLGKAWPSGCGGPYCWLSHGQ